MAGYVINTTTKRIFLPGSYFGEEEIVFKRDRKDAYVSETQCYILKYDRATFN
jgi:hypothetical protein